MEELADIGLLNGMVAESKQQGEATNKRKRSIESLRRKRIKRNKEKRERRRDLSKDERRLENVEKISGHFKEEVNRLECSLQISKADYRKERKISAFYWNKCMEQGNIQSNHQSPSSEIRRINRKNLVNEKEHSFWLGKGAFGKCRKMNYRDIHVAVKYFRSSSKESDVLWEASVINKCDHPGLPLLLGVCLVDHPLIMITQFHGIDGRCVTLTSAVKKTLWTNLSELARMFEEIVDALAFVHSIGFLHNDIKGDNVIITQHNSIFHPIIIDFGKSRRIQDGKHYCLSKKEQEIYRQRYCHIAPELIKGMHKQSCRSDIYSLGVLMANVCTKYHKYELLSDIAKECMTDNPNERPTLDDINIKLSR